MQPTRFRSLHRFDARSLTLFASLTMGGTHAIMAQSIYPAPPTPRSMHAAAASAAPETPVLQARSATPSAPVSATPTPEQAFARADSNGDGQLTQGEAERYPAVAERFREFDTDRNGMLSREEFIQALKQH